MKIRFPEVVTGWNSVFRFAEIRTESLAAKQGLYPADAIVGNLAREVDAAIIGMIITVIKLA